MRLSLSTRVFLGFVVVLVALGGTSAYTLLRMTGLRERVTLIWEEVMPVSTQLKETSRRLRAPEEFLDLRRPTDPQWLSRLLPSLQPFRQIEAIEARLEGLAEEEALPEEDRALLQAVAARLREFREGGDLALALGDEARDLAAGAKTSEEAFDLVVAKVVAEAGRGTLAAGSKEVRAMVRALRRVNRAVIEASRSVAEPIRDLNARAADDEKAATLAVLLVASGALLLSLLMLVVIQLGLRPIRRLQAGARRIAAGDYGHRLDVRSRDEVGDLAREFDTMAEALRDRDLELARRREELLRADRLATIGKVAAQITHEVRNPLSSIGLNAELLEEELEELPDGDEARKLLGDIHREVQRLKAITEEYLTYARLPKPELQPVDVGALLRELLAFLRVELESSGVEVREEGIRPQPEGGPPPVLADPDQLRQAFLNIARNAREALEEVPPPRILEVSLAARDDGGVDVVFEDRGPGLSAALAGRLFEPFVTGKAGGTGLGLALTQQILRDHGGEVRAGPREDGGPGARFVVTLPATPPAGPVVAGARTE